MTIDTAVPLRRQALKESTSISILGLIAAQKLDIHRACAFYVGADDIIDIAPLWEVQMDMLPEEQAIQALEARGYDEQMLIEALKGRDARLRI